MPRRRRRAAGEVTGYGRAVTARKRTRGMRETLGDPDDGRVEFRTDESGGVTVVVDGHPQSYVDPHDPGLLAFEYVQHLATCLDALDPPAPQRLTITHLGGAAMTLARYVEHTRPGSPQLVLEPDARLTERVRAHLPLPRGHRIRVRPTDGRAGMAALATDSADVVVLDAFDRGTVPPDLTTLEALAECARVLRPGGVWLANLADEPTRRYVARVGATARAAGLRHQLLVGTHDVLKGRRFGNTVLCASAQTLPADEIARRLARSPFPSGVLGAQRLSRDARPFTDADRAASPTPPDPGRWRVR